jgi:hypothetical protein
LINYYLPTDSAENITIEILDSNGKHIKTFTSEAPPARPQHEEGAPTGDEESDDNPGRSRAVPVQLEKTAGMHRFSWDLRYPGPWTGVATPESANGPVAVPGKYTVKLTAGSYTSSQPLTLIEDPRIAADGVTAADLQEQFDHNIMVRDLVSEVNKSVSRVRQARTKLTGDPEKLAKLNAVASHLITPTIRYSKPELQTHITYLYSLTNATDQQIGRDSVERYKVLKQELDDLNAQLQAILGAQFADLGTPAFPGTVGISAADDDDQ